MKPAQKSSRLNRLMVVAVLLCSLLSAACGTGWQQVQPTIITGPAPQASGQGAATPAAPSFSVQQLQPEIRKAYLTMVNDVAVPVDKVKIAQAGLTGLADKLKLAGETRTQALNADFNNDTEHNTGILNDKFAALYQQYGQAQGQQPVDLMHVMLTEMAHAVGDEHTYYLTPDLATMNARSRSGQDNFSGIGVAVRRQDNGGPVVVEVFPDSPAQKAGITPGDILLAVNGQDITIPDVDFISLIRGPKGTPVTLTVQHGVAAKPVDITVIRDDISQQITSSRVISDDIGYIRIYEFVTTPSYPLVNRVEDALKQADQQNIKGLILDLRGNPGGDVEQLQLIASLFIPHNNDQRAVGYFHYASGKEEPITMTGKLWPHTYNIAVLVNESSGSAAEILALALQQYNAGYLIGTKTAGAVGSTTPIRFIDKSELWYTNSVIYAPVTHTTPNQKGVEPNLVVPDPAVQDYINNFDPQLQAALTYLKSKLQQGTRTQTATP